MAADQKLTNSIIITFIVYSLITTNVTPSSFSQHLKFVLGSFYKLFIVCNFHMNFYNLLFCLTIIIVPIDEKYWFKFKSIILNKHSCDGVYSFIVICFSYMFAFDIQKRALLTVLCSWINICTYNHWFFLQNNLKFCLNLLKSKEKDVCSSQVLLLY